MRLIGVLAFAVPLVAADLWLKSAATTPPWTYHQRDIPWVILCLAMIPLVLVAARIPSSLVQPAAAMLLAGIAGNLLSALSNDLLVPNPILVRGEGAELAFNLADLYAMVGIVVLIAAVFAWLMQRRSASATQAVAEAHERLPLT